RLADHQSAPGPQEAHGALGGHRRRAERPRDHGVERPPQVGPASRLLGPGLDHDDPPGGVEGRHRLPQEPAGPLPGVEQRHLQLRSKVGHDQAGDAAAGSEVEDAAAFRQPGQQRPGVGHVPVHRPGPEEAERLGPAQHLGQGGVAQDEPELASDLMTTHRRGSSPSDTVATPSISFTMSWTILRSTGDIGSNTWSRPDSSARWAAWRANSASASCRRARYPAMSTWIRAPWPPIRRCTAVRTSSWMASTVAARGPISRPRSLPVMSTITSSSPSARADTVAGRPKRSTRPRVKDSANSACSSSDTSEPDTAASSSSPFELDSGVVALAAPDAPEGFRRRRRRAADPDEEPSPPAALAPRSAA